MNTISGWIRRLWIAFAGLRLEKKLIVIFIVLLSLPIMLTSYLSFQRYAASIEQNTTTYVGQMSNNILDKLDTYFSDLNRISSMPLYSQDLEQYLRQPAFTPQKQQFLQLQVLALNNLKSETTSVYLIDNYNNLYYNIRTNGIRPDFWESLPEWRRLAHQAGGVPVFISANEDDMPSKRTNYYFTVVRELRSSNNFEPLGLIVFDTKLDVIQQTVAQLDKVTKGKTVIVDDRNKVIYDSGMQRIGEDAGDDPVIQGAKGEQGSYQAVEDGRDYLINYTTSAASGWRIFSYIPKEELTSGVRSIRNITILLTLGIIGFALLVSVFLSYVLTRPLRGLTSLMKQVRTGNLDVRFQVKYEDEAGVMGHQFNLMLSQINALLHEVQQEQERKRRADIRALQSQINPHFIYNTLETIRMMAVINEDEVISEMTFVLGKLLRYSIIRANEQVTVKDELEHLENYLYLQNVRFRDRFSLEADIPEPCMELRTIKLLFQPIVENALFHGLEHKADRSTIRIYVDPEEEGGYLTFVIEDDGVGMDEETLERLTRRLEADENEGHPASRFGIGLRNVHERIRLYYGPDCGLRIESRAGAGTRVYIRIRPDAEGGPGDEIDDRG